MMEQYRLLAETILPKGMLDWFDFKRVEVEEVGDKTVLHFYLDENELRPDGRTDLHPNGFTRESVFTISPFVAERFFFTCVVAGGRMLLGRM